MIGFGVILRLLKGREIKRKRKVLPNLKMIGQLISHNCLSF